MWTLLVLKKHFKAISEIGKKKFSIWIHLSQRKTATNVMHWAGSRCIWQEVKCLKWRSEHGRGAFLELSFSQMLTSDRARAPFNPSFSSFKLISPSSYGSSVIAKCKPSDMKKRERAKEKKKAHTCCRDFISTLFLPLLPFISENKINERRTFRAPVLSSPPSSSPYDKGFH